MTFLSMFSETFGACLAIRSRLVACSMLIENCEDAPGAFQCEGLRLARLAPWSLIAAVAHCEAILIARRIGINAPHILQ
jgi:hypothetical protein